MDYTENEQKALAALCNRMFSHDNEVDFDWQLFDVGRGEVRAFAAMECGYDVGLIRQAGSGDHTFGLFDGSRITYDAPVLINAFCAINQQQPDLHIDLRDTLHDIQEEMANRERQHDEVIMAISSVTGEVNRLLGDPPLDSVEEADQRRQTEKFSPPPEEDEEDDVVDDLSDEALDEQFHDAVSKEEAEEDFQEAMGDMVDEFETEARDQAAAETDVDPAPEEDEVLASLPIGPAAPAAPPASTTPKARKKLRRVKKKKKPGTHVLDPPDAKE